MCARQEQYHVYTMGSIWQYSFEVAFALQNGGALQTFDKKTESIENKKFGKEE